MVHVAAMRYCFGDVSVVVLGFLHVFNSDLRNRQRM